MPCRCAIDQRIGGSTAPPRCVCSSARGISVGFGISDSISTARFARWRVPSTPPFPPLSGPRPRPSAVVAHCAQPSDTLGSTQTQQSADNNHATRSSNQGRWSRGAEGQAVPEQPTNEFPRFQPAHPRRPQGIRVNYLQPNLHERPKDCSPQARHIANSFSRSVTRASHSGRGTRSARFQVFAGCGIATCPPFRTMPCRVS